jgi:hypothetical protein
VADAVELAHRDWQEWIPAGEQPAFRPTLQPPCSQQLQKLRRQHGVPILAALAHLDTDQHALGIDVADPQHDDLAAAQAGAVGDAERSLVLETRTWRGLDQLGHLIWSKHPRQLARIVRARQLMGKVGAAERDGEEEAQRRGLPIIFGGCAPSSTCASWKRRMSSPVAVSGERPRNLAKASTFRI